MVQTPEHSIDHLLRDRPLQEQERIQQAYLFADEAHRGQRRHSGEPYIIHPIAVAEILHNLSLDYETIVAALLHDTLEDTAATEEDIRNRFGETVLFLVSAVTKIKDIENRDSRETSYRTLMRMFFAMADDIRVILIKLADRLHNLKTLGHMPPEKQREIALKSIEMYAPVAERLNMGDMKGMIEDLAFPYAYPKEYTQLTELAKEYFANRNEYMIKTRPIIERILWDHNISTHSIDCRVKHYYSLFQKLKRKNNNINQIHDLVAFRIVVQSLEDCYKTLGIIHQQYRPLPKLIKDYIAIPKPNGYQSIHTTVFCEDGQLVEIQIRTHDMHIHAENGIAAHWAYSEQGKNRHTKASIQELSVINQLREWRENIKNPEEFYRTLKLDLFKNRIFVFTPKGDIKDLPENSTPLDFAYSIHSDIGDTCSGAMVNGKIVPLRYKLENGDVCQILNSRRQKPTHDWLKIATTTQAKSHIRTKLKSKKT